VFLTEIPTEMTTLTSTSFGFFNMYDLDFQGEFQGVTYVRNLPINVSFSIWWTISADYDDPRIYSGTWDITSGEGMGSLSVPWDLDGNGFLSSLDFICYFVIFIDGLGVYENVTIETPVTILQPLNVGLQIPTLTYSDQSTFNFQVRPLFDYLFVEDLDLTITLYASDDNTTWVLINEITTATSGLQSMNWECTYSGILFFKAETGKTELYSTSRVYAHSQIQKETTILTLEDVGNFTYSDQGVLVAYLSTDDGTPISDQTVFLEISDGTWVSVGSGLTNNSGHVSILWIPTLQAGEYSIQIRMSFSDSQFYLSPNNTMGILVIDKETTVISVDTSQGVAVARVTDDDGMPIPSIQVHFYVGSNHEYGGFATTDINGYSELNITLSDGEFLEAVVNEDGYYRGSSQQITVSIPLDPMFVISILSTICFVTAPIAIGRKIYRGRAKDEPSTVSPEVSKALEEERDSIPERVREHSEKRLAELDGIEIDSEESSETLSFDDDST
ncbi:MAG: Ig-like domain-containing protein, partial [Candidatus Thorarchaeota archaeon]